jgi:hypothetical protein
VQAAERLYAVSHSETAQPEAASSGGLQLAEARFASAAFGLPCRTLMRPLRAAENLRLADARRKAAPSAAYGRSAADPSITSGRKLTGTSV